MKRIACLLVLVFAALCYEQQAAAEWCHTCINYACHTYVIPERGVGQVVCIQQEFGCNFQGSPSCYFGECEIRCGPDSQWY